MFDTSRDASYATAMRTVNSDDNGDDDDDADTVARKEGLSVVRILSAVKCSVKCKCEHFASVV